jgi:F0F1-type ATP synthase delta subunit
MKTFIEIVSEVAWQNGDPSLSAFIKLNLEQEHLDLLQQAADVYASQSNSHNCT